MPSPIVLQRIRSYTDATLGILTFGTRELFTLERPWKQNEARVSCIPPGHYELERHHTRRFPDHFALLGGTVSHWPSADHPRSAILMHSANRVTQLQGCIAPGWKANFGEHPVRVEQSRTALSVLHNWIRDHDVREFHIVGGPSQ